MVALGREGADGARIEWHAEIINDKPHELIAWRTVGVAHRARRLGPFRGQT